MKNNLFGNKDENLNTRLEATSGRFEELSADDLAMVAGGANTTVNSTSDYGGCCCKTYGSECPSCDMVDKSCCPKLSRS